MKVMRDFEIHDEVKYVSEENKNENIKSKCMSKEQERIFLEQTRCQLVGISKTKYLID